MESIYLKLWELAKPYYEKGRIYDVPHIEWMMKQANEIADIENVDKKLLLPIVILHDVGYSVLNESNPDVKDRNSKIVHMREGALISKKILDELNYDDKLKEKIVHYISVHDNWILGDDSPYKECKEMAIFNDLDFLYTFSNYDHFILNAKSMGKTPEEAHDFWLQDEKLVRRPFCCESTKKLFNQYINERKKDVYGAQVVLV